MSNVGSGVANISIHLAHHSDVFVAVEERVLVLPVGTRTTPAAVRSFVGFEAGIRQNNNEPLRILVGRRNRCILLRYQLR